MKIVGEESVAAQYQLKTILKNKVERFHEITHCCGNQSRKERHTFFTDTDRLNRVRISFYWICILDSREADTLKTKQIYIVDFYFFRIYFSINHNKIMMTLYLTLDYCVSNFGWTEDED